MDVVVYVRLFIVLDKLRRFMPILHELRHTATL